jgi:hypothetical protein
MLSGLQIVSPATKLSGRPTPEQEKNILREPIHIQLGLRDGTILKLDLYAWSAEELGVAISNSLQCNFMTLFSWSVLLSAIQLANGSASPQ